MNLLFLGHPYTGKGTYSKVIEVEFDLFHFSTGDLLREIITNTPICVQNRPRILFVDHNTH